MARSLHHAPRTGRPEAAGRPVRVRLTPDAERTIRDAWPDSIPIHYAAQAIISQWVANRIQKMKARKGA